MRVDDEAFPEQIRLQRLTVRFLQYEHGKRKSYREVPNDTWRIRVDGMGSNRIEGEICILIL